jgi:hypothetical protein
MNSLDICELMVITIKSYIFKLFTTTDNTLLTTMFIFYYLFKLQMCFYPVAVVLQ